MDISTIQSSTQISPEVKLESGILSHAITIHKWMDFNTLPASATTPLNKDIPCQLSHTHSMHLLHSIQRVRNTSDSSFLEFEL